MTYHAALITGASSGIGEAFARALPGDTHLLLTGRDQARLEALSDQLVIPERKIEVLSGDLTDETFRLAVIEAAEALEIDLFMNNAGLGAFGPMTATDAAAEAQMVALNCAAVAHLTHALVPGLLQRARNWNKRSGLIVVASTAALHPLPYLSTYAATKAFDYFLAEGLAAELAGEPVDVLTLCPGPTETRFFERAGGRPARSSGKASAESVAQAALRSLGKKRVEVVGASNKAYALALKVLPGPIKRALIKRAMAGSL